MLVKIFGWMWIIAGSIFLLKPQMLKNRLQKKGIRKLRKYLFLLSVTLGGLLISVGWHFHGFFSKVVVVAGIIAIFKAAILLKAKATDKMLEWSAARPLIFFRIGACVWIFIGGIILVLR